MFARSPDTLSTLADEARAEHVALIAADELSSLQETAHLLRSPANAVRLLSALRRVQQRSLAPQRIELLRQEAGLDPAE
ncbi:MAG: prevent-host-death protein [Gemmatimonadota bacterium]|nr:prevent-host-death protein [Gemmatimonadota bacterium]